MEERRITLVLKRGQENKTENTCSYFFELFSDFCFSHEKADLNERNNEVFLEVNPCEQSLYLN